MDWALITKPPKRWVVRPHLLDYDTTCATFSWDAIRRELAGLPGGQGLNIAYEAVDRHADGPHRDHLALRWLARDGAIRDFTYGDLQEQSNRFANVLRQLGVDKGDRVFVPAGRIPDLYIAALGTLKNRSVFCPLFSAFGPEPIFQRLSKGDASVLVTTRRLYTQKVAGLRARLPQQWPASRPVCGARSPRRWPARTARSRTTTWRRVSTCAARSAGWRPRTRSGRSKSGCCPQCCC